VFRITVKMLPEREPAGLEEFEQEAAMLMAALAEADSLKQVRQDSLKDRVSHRRTRTIPSFQQSTETYRVQTVDINRADSADLLPLPGIGPVFAGRIIRYRNLLGGFVSVDQLGEVYGIPRETVEKIGSQLYFDSTAIRRIHIDSATFRELLRHPYLEYEDVKALVEFRDFKGDIGSVNELEINHILADSTLNKIDGYFEYR
jgi:competence ComEA-like helix-hairpin-helix protein